MRAVIKNIARIKRSTFWFDLLHPSLTIIGIYTRLFRNLLYEKLTNNNVRYSWEIYSWEQGYARNFISSEPPYVADWNLEYSKMGQILGILSKDFSEELKLIDVGSGPVTRFSRYLDINAWNIATVDPLAQVYNHLNEKYRINYPLKCIEGTGERLDELLDEHSFHLVLSENAMDHAISPQDFINKLFYVLKPGGFLYLGGAIKEGEREHWTGLHQHNLDIAGDQLLWTNRDKNICNLNITESFGMELFYKSAEGSNPGDHYTLIYRKKN